MHKIKAYRISKNIFWKIPKCFFIVISFFLIYYYYYSSLEACNEDINICASRYEWIKTKIKEEVISCFILEMMIQLMLYKYLSKKHIIHISIVLGYFFYKSHGLSFDDHGYFNFLYYLILLVLFTIVFIPFGFFIIHCGFKDITLKLIMKNCNDWPKGLNNTYIENNRTKYDCQIKIPKICIYKNLEYFQDYSSLIRKDCKNQNGKKAKENILKYSTSPYIDKKVNRIGYPQLNKDKSCLQDFRDKNNMLRKYLLKNLVDMDKKDILIKHFKDKIPEVEIDFTNIKEPKLNINVQYNKTLSKKRKLLEKKVQPYSNNILLLYLDSVSRVNGLRQLKKTTKFFEKFMSYKGGFHHKYPSENFHSFQFFKYHSFLGYTTINFPLLFYGEKYKEKNRILITKFFKENGFITSAANDYCQIDNVRAHHKFSFAEMYDHIFYLCDPNNKNINVNTIRCLYGKNNYEHLLEYTNQFWRKYQNNRKYSIIIGNQGHEGTLTVIKHSDDLIYNFLNNLFEDNLLKETTIFLLSDHGVGMPSIYFTSQFYQMEINLPMLFIIVNDRKNVSYEEQYKFIHENQQIFITAFDIYNSLGHILYGNKYYQIQSKSKKKNSCKSKYGRSLFEKMNAKGRFSKKYKHFKKIGFSELACK